MVRSRKHQEGGRGDVEVRGMWSGREPGASLPSGPPSQRPSAHLGIGLALGGLSMEGRPLRQAMSQHIPLATEVSAGVDAEGVNKSKQIEEGLGMLGQSPSLCLQRHEPRSPKPGSCW